MNEFKFFNGNKINDEIKYVKNYLKNYPETKIVVGTDSEQYKKYTNYVTVIGMIKPRKGVHIIYKSKRTKKIKDIFSRLWNEIEYSRLVADDLEKHINNTEKKIITLHIDINNNKKEKSYIVHDSAVGYLKGLGYNVESKPNGWIATKAADWLC